MENWHNKIDDYVKDLLKEDEKKDFEIELKKNEKLYEETELSKAIVNQFKFDKIIQTTNQARLENERTDEKYETISKTILQAKTENIESRRKRIRLYQRISIAAVFCFAFGPILYLMNANEDPAFITDIVVKEADLQEVAAFKVARIDSLVALANVALSDKNFDPVLALTDQLRNEEEFETDEMLQDECYIYFEQQNYIEANRRVNRIVDLKLKDKIRWKLSLAYINVGENEFAKEQLSQIQDGPYKKRALRKLKKMS